jgi:hypothetical protein
MDPMSFSFIVQAPTFSIREAIEQGFAVQFRKGMTVSEDFNDLYVYLVLSTQKDNRQRVQLHMLPRCLLKE